MSYDESWDKPHKPGTEAGWQESDCYWFYDAATGVGGYQRIGQKPNAGTGQVTLFVFDREGERYTANDAYERDRPISAADRWETGHQVETHRADALGDGRMRYRWDEPGSSADIEFCESFHMPRGWSKSSHEAQFMEAMNPGGHLECSGRIKGTVRIGERSYEIDALAHRDRSWGFRDFSQFDYRRFRMFSGTVGPELSFATFVCDTAHGRTVSGFVVRDGVDEDISDLRVLVTIDADGLTAMGGTAVITLQSGEKLEVPYKAVQAYLTKFPANNGFLIDSISEVSFAGKTGFCDAIHSINPARGTAMPNQSDSPIVAIDNGLSKSASYAL